MTAYERIRFQFEGTKYTVILRDPAIVRIAGTTAVTGIEVDRHGSEIAPRGADERRRIIDLSLVTSRTPLRFNRHYAVLEADR